MAGIYTEDKMKQKPVYPTRETAQYSDWALFNMGKALEAVVDELEPGGGKPLEAENPLVITEEETRKVIGMKVGNGLAVDSDGELHLDFMTGNGLNYLYNELYLIPHNPIKVDVDGIGIKEGDNLTINSDGELDVELHCGLGLIWDKTKASYAEDTLRLDLDAVIGSDGAIRVTAGHYPDQINLDVIRYNTQAFWDGEQYDDNNILGSGIIKKNVDSKVSKAGVQSPLSINANDELVLGVGSGLELDSTGTQLQARLGTGLKFDGTNHISVDDKLQYEYGYKIVNGLQMFGVTEITVPANRTYECRCTRGAIISLLPSGWEPVENAPIVVNTITTSFVLIGSGGVVTSTGVIMYLRNINEQNKTLNELTFSIPCRKAL